MSLIHAHDDHPSRRPRWLPHPKVLGFILLLWAVAGAANVLTWPGH